MNRKLWLVLLGLFSMSAYAQNAQTSEPNPYVTNTQQLLDSSAAQAKQNLMKSYPPPVPMTPNGAVNTSASGTIAQPPPAQNVPTPPPEPTATQPPTDSSTQETTSQPTNQANIAVTPNSTGSGGNQQSTNIYSPGGGSSSGTTSGSNSGANNMYR